MRLVVFFMLITTMSLSHSREQLQSGPRQVVLLELYTSEGCSSCPPADAWLSNLKQHDQLFRRFVPVAFHVDYWDYLGWRDEFAMAEFSARQRQYHQIQRTASVYTPGFVINGEEWRGFFNLRTRNQPPLTQEIAPEVGNLSLIGEHQTYRVSFTPTRTLNEALVINVAHLGMDERNDVRRGENAGKRLSHDFVVLKLVSQPLRLEAQQWQTELDRTPVPGAKAIAAWVSTRADPAPIQAVGGWLAVH
jgi:hypothetical protein